MKKIMRGDFGGAVLCALLSLVFLFSAVVLQIRSFNARDMSAAQVRSAAAAHQVAAQFNQAVEDAFRQLKVGSVALKSGDDVIDDMLRSLHENGSFSRAALLNGGTLRFHDGSTAEAAMERVYVPYQMGEMHGRIVMDSEGHIHLHLSVDAENELVGWMDIAYIEALMNGAYAEEYGCAIYNSATGAYLLNASDNDESRYYDTLMRVNEDGRASQLMYDQEAQAYIPGADGEGYYIAQCPTGLGNWSVALFIDEGILESAADPMYTGAYIRLLLLALSMIFAAAFVLLLVHMIRKMRSQLRKKEARLEEMLALSTEDAQMACFVYNVEQDRIEHYVDGIRIAAAESGKTPHRLTSLARVYGLDEEDAARLSDRVKELKAGESLCLKLRSALADEERVLRFEVSALRDGDVCGSIRDWTAETARENVEKEEERFLSSMQRKASSVWEIDAARNRWRITSGIMPSMLRTLGVNESGWHNYTNDLNGPLKQFMDAGDFDRYYAVMSLNGLRALLRSGKTEQTMECRVRADADSAYQWYRLLVRVYRGENGDLRANLFVSNVNAAKNAEMEKQERTRILHKTLTALGGVYYGLYYVELDKDLSYTAKAKGSLSPRLSQSFRQTVDDFIAREVHPADQEQLRGKLSVYQLRRSLTEESHLQRHEYRRKKGEEYEDAAVIVQAARFENGTVRDIVVAMRKYDGSSRVSLEN